jgi:hypothetical protein
MAGLDLNFATWRADGLITADSKELNKVITGDVNREPMSGIREA